LERKFSAEEKQTEVHSPLINCSYLYIYQLHITLNPILNVNIKKNNAKYSQNQAVSSFLPTQSH